VHPWMATMCKNPYLPCKGLRFVTGQCFCNHLCNDVITKYSMNKSDQIFWMQKDQYEGCWEIIETFLPNIIKKTCAKFQWHNIITEWILTYKRICTYQLTWSNRQNCFNVIVTQDKCYWFMSQLFFFKIFST
jgi:hypothetical protein